MIIKITFIAIICIFISSIIKPCSVEFSTIINVCGAVLIFLICIDELGAIVEYFTELYDMTNLNLDFLKLILKVVGVGYITEFTADIAEDFGNKVMASKVVLGGKIVVCGMTLPIIKKLLSVLFSVLS